MMLQVADAAMVGRVSVSALAAASFGSNIIHIFMLFGFGLCIPVHILVAESYGRKDAREGVRWLLTGLWISVIYAVAVLVFVLLFLDWLDHFGQEPEVAELAKGFLVYLAWSMLPVMGYQCLKNFSEARHSAWIPFAVLIFGFLLNVFLNWILIYGNWGAPSLGLEGAGIATLVARCMMLIILAVIIYRSEIRQFTGLNTLWSGLFAESRIRQWMSLGVPGAFQILFEAGAFILAAFMMGWISANTLAAHHIAVTYAGLVFMVPLGLSFATCIQIASLVGRGELEKLKRTVWTNIFLGAGFMAICAVITFVLRDWIPTWFVETEETEVIALASSFLMIVAFFHLFDGIQVVTLGVLRGLSDLKIPMLLLFISFWPCGLFLGYWLAFKCELYGVGMWWGLLSGLVFAAVLLLMRIAWLMRQRKNL